MSFRERIMHKPARIIIERRSRGIQLLRVVTHVAVERRQRKIASNVHIVKFDEVDVLKADRHLFCPIDCRQIVRLKIGEHTISGPIEIARGAHL
jgi:hypothetical protein